MLTYNFLHELEVSGWSVGPAESKEEQGTRFNLQARKLSLAQPHVLLLQEVNPLPEKADAYVTALTTSGGQYTEVHQADACGIRLFGLRIIPGLNNGMAILAKAPLRLRKVAGLKLSGGLGGCGDSLDCNWVSFGTRSSQKLKILPRATSFLRSACTCTPASNEPPISSGE